MAKELRQDLITGEWTVYAPLRSERPNEMRTSHAETGAAKAWEESCPFCPGNEDRITPIFLETSTRNGHAWSTRTFENSYPALAPDLKGSPRRHGIYQILPGFGRHEVIIDTPYHDRDISSMTTVEVQAVLETYLLRYHDLRRTYPGLTPVIVRNYGPTGGASIRHPHSQIIATPTTPAQVERREQGAEAYFEQHGSCPYCDMLQFEDKERHRVVLENDSFLGFVPFAPEFPYELWLLPRRHRSDFGDLDPAELTDLSTMLRAALGKIRQALNDPSYNYLILPPSRYRQVLPHLHWYFRIIPRFANQPGLEVGAGVRICPSMPEANAEILRGAEA